MYGHVSLLNVQIYSTHVKEATLCVCVGNLVSGLMKMDKVTCAYNVCIYAGFEK